MNILFVHEVDWLNKVVFDIHSLAEGLSLLGHRVYGIDYENTWGKSGSWGWGSLKTREVDGVSRAFPGASVCLRRPGFIRVPGLSRLSAGFTHCFEIENTIKEKGIDAIVLYSAATNGLQTVHLAGKYNIPVLFRSIDILNQLVPYAALRPITRFLEKRVYSRADAILTLTPKLSRYVVDFGADEARVSLLPMPVDTNLFHPAPPSAELKQKWGLDEDDEIIVFIGTLFDFSGLDVFLRRFLEVIAKFPRARLLIVGDGPQRLKLEGIIAELGLEGRATITGFQPYETMPQYINLASVCINPFLITDATRDIFPGKTVQYLACGKPMLATALPGMIAVIPDESKGVVYADNADGIADKLIPLLESAEYRRRVGQAGAEYVKRVHSHDIIARQLEARIAEAIKYKGEKKWSNI